MDKFKKWCDLFQAWCEEIDGDKKFCENKIFGPGCDECEHCKEIGKKK